MGLPAPVWSVWVFVARTLKVLAFPLMTVLLGHLVLFNIEQAQEAMQAALDDGVRAPAVWFFAAGYFVWSLSVWYTSRLLLCIRWSTPNDAWSDPIGRCVSPRLACIWVTWLPRLLAMASSLPTVWVMWARGQAGAAAAWSLASLVLLAGLVFRRQVWRWLQGVSAKVDLIYTQTVGEQWPHFTRVSGGAWVLLTLMAAGPWLIVLSGWVAGQQQLTDVARWVGTPGLVLLGLASYNVVGSMVLVYAPMRRGWGSWAVLPVVMLMGLSTVNDNHGVGQRLEIKPPGMAPLAIQTDLNRWLSKRHADGRDDDPIYLVALSGGASRSAYWGAYTLAVLEDALRREGRSFMANVYAMSGVSGGSLGAAALVSFLANDRDAAARSAVMPLTDRVTELLTKDYMAPATQAMLYVDLMGRLSPWPLPALDRSHALERSWENDFEDMQISPFSGRTMGSINWFKKPIESLYQPAKERCGDSPSGSQQATCIALLPRLILNAASAQTGTPVLQTALDLSHPLAVHMRDPGLDLDHMTLSEAVHNSARFPFLSPAGRVLSKDGVHAVDYWVDGGYFENSGAWSLQLLLQTWSQLPQWQADPQGWRDLLARIRVIVFTNDPVQADSPSWLPPDGVSHAGSSGAVKPVPPNWMMDLLAPAKGLYAARTARAQSETFRLAQMLALWRSQASLAVEPVIYQLKMPLTTAETPSMNWFINRRSSCVLRSYVLGRDVCPASNVPSMPAGWTQASGYQRYQAELIRLRLQLGLERVIQQPVVAQGLLPQTLRGLQPTP